MNDNAQHTGQNWTGRAPRTLEEAGLQYGKFRARQEIYLMDWIERLSDVVLAIAWVASLGLMFWLGAVVGF